MLAGLRHSRGSAGNFRARASYIMSSQNGAVKCQVFAIEDSLGNPIMKDICMHLLSEYEAWHSL